MAGQVKLAEAHWKNLNNRDLKIDHLQKTVRMETLSLLNMIDTRSLQMILTLLK
jgi:hypothetical protein